MLKVHLWKLLLNVLHMRAESLYSTIYFQYISSYQTNVNTGAESYFVWLQRRRSNVLLPKVLINSQTMV